MRKLIKQLLREGLVREMSEDMEELYLNMTRDIFHQINLSEKLTFKRIPKNQYIKALREFIKFGRFINFPTKYIISWKYRCLNNIFKLSSTTEIFGHTSNFPIDEFLSVFDYNSNTGEDEAGEYTDWLINKREEYPDNEEYKDKYSYYNCAEFLDDVKKVDDLIPTFSNGQYLLSDYGLEPLLKLAYELDSKESPEEIIVVINKILDVSHQRSDLAELFIEGGSGTLDYVSNN